MLGTAVFAYFVSIIERSSMGVASLAAAERFSVGAAALSSLAAAQLAVYAIMQIPVGLLLDRFGSRRLIVFGSVATGVGNLLVSMSQSIGLAVAGRMIVGFGDAFVFISMIRLINAWTPGSRATQFTQLFANLGQLGQIASAVPFAYLLGIQGWSFAFTAASALAFLAASLGLLILKDGPEASTHKQLANGAGFWSQFKHNFRDPFTRKAFWVHFTLQSSGSLFILLWGYPFLVEGEGLSHEVAAVLLGSFVVIGFGVGPILSKLCLRYPAYRYRLVNVVYALLTSVWLLVVLTPGQNPMWQLILLVIVIGSGGPASMIAFDYSRTTIEPSRLGSANGVVNTGGFVATFTSMFLVGIALDAIRASGVLGASGLYSLAAFKLALPVQLLVISLGLLAFHHERRKAMTWNKTTRRPV